MYASRTIQHTVQHTIQHTVQHTVQYTVPHTIQHTTQHTGSEDHPTPQALVHIHESCPPAYTQPHIIHYVSHVPTQINKVTHQTHTQEAKPQKVLPRPPSPQALVHIHHPPPLTPHPCLYMSHVPSHIRESHNTTHTGGQTAGSATTTTSLHTPQHHPRANPRLMHHMATGTISQKSALRSFYIGNIVVSSLLRNSTRAQIRENYTAWQAQFLKSQLYGQFT